MMLTTTNSTFFAACMNGDLQAVKIAVKNENMTAKWSRGMEMVCKRGFIDIAEYIIEHGRNAYGWSNAGYNATNSGLYGACKNGHVKLAIFLIDQGADDFSCGLSISCLNGQLETAMLMMQYVDLTSKLNKYFISACEGGNSQIVEIFLQKGDDNISGGLELACLRGNLEVAEMLVKTGTSVSELNLCMDKAISRNHLHIIKMLIKYGANYYVILNTNNFSEYSLYCKYMRINTHKCERYRYLLYGYQVYQIWLGRIIAIRRNSDDNVNGNDESVVNYKSCIRCSGHGGRGGRGGYEIVKTNKNQLGRLPGEIISMLDKFFS